MIPLAIFLLACAGMTFLFRSSSLFGDMIPVRPVLRQVPGLSKIAECSFCMGVWVSAALWSFWVVKDSLLVAGLGSVSLLAFGLLFRELRTWKKALALVPIGAIFGLAVAGPVRHAILISNIDVVKTLGFYTFAGAAAAYLFDAVALALEKHGNSDG